MPPKMQLMPGLRTRASNKDKHPGLILKGNSRRTAEEMSQLREEVAAHREAEGQRLTMALENIAQIEDMRCEKDDELEIERRQRREELRQHFINYMLTKTHRSFEEKNIYHMEQLLRTKMLKKTKKTISVSACMHICVEHATQCKATLRLIHPLYYSLA
jgi:hypothetical protein